MVGNGYEAMRVVQREADPYLEPTILGDMIAALATKANVVVASIAPEVLFSS